MHLYFIKGSNGADISSSLTLYQSIHQVLQGNESTEIFFVFYQFYDSLNRNHICMTEE